MKFLAGLIVILLSHASYANDVAGKLEGEKSVSGVVTGTGVDSYTFEVTAGRNFLVNVSETGSHVAHFTPWLKLTGPDKKVKTDYGQELFVRVTNPDLLAGEYTVEVSRHDAGTIGGAYKIWLTQIPGAKGTPMEAGKSYTGAIVRGSVDVYTFIGTSGAKAHLNLTAKEGAGFMLGANVFSPGGEAIGGNDCKDTCAVDVEMKQPGEYTAMIWRDDQNDNKGAYSVSLLQAGTAPLSYPADAKNGVPLLHNQQYAGNISGDAVHLYTLSGDQGSIMELTLSPQGFSPLITAFGPDGELIGTERCSDSCHLDLPPLRSGTYKIMVWRKDQNDPPGSYTLSILNGNTAQGRPFSLPPGNPSDSSTASPLAHEVPPSMIVLPDRIESGKPLTGAIKGLATNSYTFKAVNSSSFMIGLIKKGAPAENFSPVMRITGPDNRLVQGDSASTNLTMIKTGIAAGDWRIDVSQFASMGDGGGNYELRLQQVPGSTGTPMEFGKSYEGAIFEGGIDVYTINGTPGVTALLTLTAKSGAGFSPAVNIFTPSGKLAGNGGGPGAGSFDLAMTEYGNYTVMVSRSDQNHDKGAYSLFVKRKGDKEEPPLYVPETAYQNGADAPWPQDIVAMHRQAEIYINGQFIRFIPEYPSSEDRNAAAAGEVLKQLLWGDFSASTGRASSSAAVKYWKMAADQGNQDARNRLGVAGAVDSSGKKYEAAAWYRMVAGQAPADPDMQAAVVYLADNYDLKQAAKLYKAAADRGVAPAQYNLAVLYMDGAEGKENIPEAAKYYAKAAAQGLVAAENNLAELYEHGEGVPKDDSQALAWYQKAADAGYPLAQYHLAQFAAAGRGMPKDGAKAAEWLKKSADGGYAEAQAELYVLQGKASRAMNYWKKMAAQGDRPSLNKLVENARRAGIAAADYDDTLAAYRVAVKEVNPVAFLGLADLFARQNPPDDYEAYFWYILAQDSAKTAPIPPDEREADTAYATGESARIAKKLSPEQIAAAKWRIKDRAPPAPLDKKKEAIAAMTLHAGKLWDAGDEADAVMYYLMAASQGDAGAQHSLCDIYEFGRGGVGQDINRAIDYCKQSVRNGSIYGATILGDIYRFGVSVPVDLEASARWYEIDASRGVRKARDRLGWLYLQGIPGSGQRAVDMYEKTAALHDHEAEDAIGMIYLYGLAGVPKDIAKARKWYGMAAEKDFSGTIQTSALLKDTEPRDYARALRLIDTFVDPVALNNTAFMYEHGLGVKERGLKPGEVAPKALDLYKHAAGMCYGRAMYNVGRLYSTGVTDQAISATPIKADPALARKWMERAAASGSTAAAIWLESRDPDTIKFDKIPKEEAGLPPEPCPKTAEKEGQKR